MKKNKNRNKKILLATMATTVAVSTSGFLLENNEEVEASVIFSYQALGGYSGEQGYAITAINDKNYTGTIVIPATYNGKKVLAINDGAFQNSQASQIIFEKPENIEHIGTSAFSGSKATNKISLPNVVYISTLGFSDSSFSEINVNSNNLMSIGAGAFQSAKATNSLSLMTISSVPDYAFNGSSFSAINLNKDRVNNIGNYAFANSKATNVLNLPMVSTIPQSAFQKSNFSQINLGNYISSIGNYAFEGSKATNSVDFRMLSSIPVGAFMNSQFNTILLDSNRVTSIFDYAFSGTKATNSITLNNVTTIPVNAFSGSDFSEIHLSDKVTSIGLYAFMDAKATNAISLQNITDVPTYAFKGSNFNQILFDSRKISTIGPGAFMDTKATNPITFQNITDIPLSAFENSNFSVIGIPGDKVTSIGSYAFRNTKSNANLSLPNVREIPFKAFENAKFSYIDLNWNNITSVGDNAFTSYENLHLSQNGQTKPVKNVTTKVYGMSQVLVEKVEYQWSPSATSVDNNKWTTIANNADVTTPNVTGNYYLHVKVTPVTKSKLPSKTMVSNVFVLDNDAPLTPKINPSTTNTTKELKINIDYSNDSVVKEYKINNGQWMSYTGQLTLTENATIYARATDEAGNTSSTSTLVITNINQNNAPTNKATIPAQTIGGKGATTTINLANYFQDIDGDVLTYTVSSNATSRVTTSLSGSTLTLTGVAKGPATITVTATDSSGEAITQTFTTTVNNTAPTGTTIPVQTIANKGATTTVNLASYFTDVDGDALTYTVSSNATNRVTGSINGSTLTLTGVEKGTATITVTATDSSGATTTQTFTTTVNNTAPTGTTIPAQTITNKGATTTVNLANYFQDTDGDALTYTVVSNATGKVTGVVNGSTLTLTGVEKGSANITVTATDSSGATTTQTFATTVNNAAPTGTTIPAQTITNKGAITTVNLANYFQDIDGDALTYTVSSNATSKVTGAVSGSTLTLTGVAKGSANITVTAIDNSGESVSQTFTTTVGNAAPTVSIIPTQEMDNIGKQINFNLSNYFQDIDGDNLTYTVTSSATDKVTSSINGTTLTLNGVGAGASTITVTAVDGAGGVVSQTFTTTVNAPAPINKNEIDTQVINGVGQSKQLNLSDYFEYTSGTLTYTINSNAMNKVSTLLNGDKLTLNGLAKGDANITVTATNPSGQFVSQTFKTTVRNTSPTLVTDFNKLNLRPGEISSVIMLTGTDADGDDLSYVVTSSNNSIVKVSVVGNQLVVEGLKDGSANVTVKVTDNDVDYGNTASTKTFTVDVGQPAPIAPEAPIDLDNTGGITNGIVNLGDIFDDENPGDLIFKPIVLVNEPQADISIKNKMLLIENPKQEGKIEVEVEATNIYGKTAIALLNVTLDEEDVKQINENAGNNGENQGEEGKATLKLMQGEFTLKTADVNDFGKVKLTAAKQTVTSNFAKDFGVVDARGTQEGWNVTVSATPFTVETFDGFMGTPHQLPLGSLALGSTLGIERINHTNTVDGLPTGLINGLTAIDTNNALNVLNANQGEGLGEFKFNFGTDALALTVDARTAKIDAVNYPDKNTPYASTVTWDLISGPQM